MTEHESNKKNLHMEWIKAESGSTYLCPADKLAELDNPTESQLKSICVDESENPHNA